MLSAAFAPSPTDTLSCAGLSARTSPIAYSPSTLVCIFLVGDDVAPLVAVDQIGDEVAVGCIAHVDEDAVGGIQLLLAGFAVDGDHAGNGLLTLNGGHLLVEEHRAVGVILDAILEDLLRARIWQEFEERHVFGVIEDR